MGPSSNHLADNPASRDSLKYYHFSGSIQLYFEDIPVICSATALGNRFRRLTTPSSFQKEENFPFVLCKHIHIYRNYIYTYIHKNTCKSLFIYLFKCSAFGDYFKFSYFFLILTHRLNMTSFISLLTQILHRSE